MDDEAALAAELAKLAVGVDKRVEAWARGKTLAVLLGTLPRICPFAIKAMNGQTAGGLLANGGGAKPSASVIRKAYLKCARHLHPDKIGQNPSLSREQKLVAERVFAIVSQKYSAQKKG